MSLPITYSAGKLAVVVRDKAVVRLLEQIRLKLDQINTLLKENVNAC